MVIIHTYLKSETGTIVACVSFSYNDGDNSPVTGREFTIDMTEDSDYESIKQEVLSILEKEKNQDVEQYSSESSDLPGFVTLDEGY